MKLTSSISLATALVAAGLLGGCYTGDPYDHYHRGPYGHRGTYEDSDHQSHPLRGTVERVNRRDRTITVEPEGGGGREMVLSYDEDTVVENEGQSYRPEDLEHGDVIAADIEQTDDGFSVQQIQVLGDAGGDERGGRDGRYGQDDRDDRGMRERDDREGDGRHEASLSGTVRSTDPSRQTVEISTRSGRHDVVVVSYDDQTVVEFQGRNYAPENLDPGDAVEVELRDSGNGRMVADRIVVVRSVQATR
jgi:hypothetical protein